MNKRRILTIGMTTLLGMSLVGCGTSSSRPRSPKPGAPALQVQKDDHVIDLGMQGAQHYSAFDKNGQARMEVRTVPHAKISLREPVRDHKYDYRVRPQSDGRYQVTFDNLGIRNEDKFPDTNYLVVQSPAYRKTAQAPISLHPTTDNLKQTIVQNVNHELDQNDIKNEDLDGKTNVSVTGPSTIDAPIKIIIESGDTPMPATDVIIAALKGIRNVDMSTFANVTISVGAKGETSWYKFTPYDIKTMPLDHLDTNDLKYISIDNHGNN